MIMNVASARDYYARLNRVLQYIDEHLDADLKVESLSAVAAFSEFHFHRQFTEAFGISVHKYIQLMRLKRASFRLAFRIECPVIEIAFESGYDSPEAFSRAFKKRFGQTPTDFRKQPEWASWQTIYEGTKKMMTTHMEHGEIASDEVRVVVFLETRVAAMEHRGDPAMILASVRAFIVWRQ